MQPTSLQVELTVSLPATFSVVFQHKNTNTVLTNISSGWMSSGWTCYYSHFNKQTIFNKRSSVTNYSSMTLQILFFLNINWSTWSGRRTLLCAFTMSPAVLKTRSAGTLVPGMHRKISVFAKAKVFPHTGPQWWLDNFSLVDFSFAIRHAMFCCLCAAAGAWRWRHR